MKKGHFIYLIYVIPITSMIIGFLYNEIVVQKRIDIILIEEINYSVVAIIFFANLLIAGIYYLLSTIGVSFIAISYFFYGIGKSISLYNSNFIYFFIGMPHTLGEILVCFQVLYLNHSLIYNGIVNKKWNISSLNYKFFFLITIFILLISSLIETFLSPFLVELFLMEGDFNK